MKQQHTYIIYTYTCDCIKMVMVSPQMDSGDRRWAFGVRPLIIRSLDPKQSRGNDSVPVA